MSDTANNPSPAKGRKALGAVLFTIFIDLVGFSILFPLMPAILRFYIPQAGPNSLIGRFEIFLRSLSPAAAGGHDAVSLVIFGGAIGSIFSVLQFLSSPVWGRLSDRFGRRRILLVTTVSTCIGYLIWAFSGNFWVYIASRVVCGLMAGNISVATAAVADTTGTSSRTRGMAFLGMSFAIGFMVGPALGGLASGIHLGDGGTGFFALNPFSGCALLSAVLAFVNFLWVLFFFPETLARENRSTHRVSFNPIGNLHVANPLVRRIIAVDFTFLLLASGMEFSLTFLAMERLGFGPQQNIAIFLFGGLTMIFSQGLFLRKRISGTMTGEKRYACAGIACSLCGMAVLGLAGNVYVFFAGLFLKAVGMSLEAPTVSSLVSRLTPPDRQGAAMGTFRAMGSLARAFGPVFVGILYWSIGSRSTYLIASIVLAVPLVMAARLPSNPFADAGGGDNRDTRT